MDVYVIDAFTDLPFQGNSAGVVVLDAPAQAAWMQAVATELNHPETAFVVPRTSDDGPDSLRWFTPTTEVPLCGHATLATAHVLGGTRRFSTRSGELICTPLDDGHIEMDFPVDQVEPREINAGLSAALPDVRITEAGAGSQFLVAQVDSAAQVRALRPNFRALAEIPMHGVVVTALGDRDGVDFVSRVFVPNAGIPEDPVTGSAHCTLVSYWSQRLGHTARETRFVGEQASARGGRVRMTLRDDRVGLAGKAVTVLRGTLLV